MAFFKKLMLIGVPAAGLTSIHFLLRSKSKEETVNINENIEDSRVEEEDEEEEGESKLDVGLIENDSNDDQILLSLLRQAGLKCKGVNDGSECQIGTKKRGVEISRDSTKDSELFFSSGKGKLVIRKINDNNYKKGIRFTVEGGDIDLKKNNGESLAFQKLERFESYGLEIEGQEENKKLYLARKQTSQQGTMRTLGLPINCTLPANTGESTKCDLNYHNQIKNVHFEGRKRGGAAAIVTNDLSAKKVHLTIEKTTEIPPFNGGYKFTFTPDVDVEISSRNTIKKDQGTDFRIIEWKDKNMSLERAWKDSDLISKAGLECTGDYCTIKNGSLNVMHDGKTLKNANANMNGAKIKLYKNQNHYENGIKLVIEDGDINLTGNGDGSVSKLSRYEGYEIVNKENVYYLNRRHLDIVEIVRLLGGICNLNNEKNPFNNNKEIRCSVLLRENFKKIKFDGIQSGGIIVTNSTSLSIEKTSETSTFRYGYKFKFTPEEDITISSDNILKKKFATYFKIKGDGESISLERAVKPDELIEKVGLQCSGNTGSEICTFKDGRKINVTLGHLILTNSTPPSGQGVGTLKLVDRNNKDYNEGLKFEVMGGDITFTGDDGSKARMGEFDTYEIKETEGKWHLHQKSNFMQNKHNAVGIPAKCNNSFSNHCNIGWEAKGINFKEKKSETVKAMFSSNASLQLRLERESMYKYGIKVLMKAFGGEDPTLSLACESYDPNILFKITKEEMEFEIEKDSNDSNRFVLVKRTGTTPSGLATDCKPPTYD